MIDVAPDKLDWQKCPLIPAVVQDAATRQVLMLGFMNRAALERTLETGCVTFYSRSRETLWTKGETSGNVLNCVRILADCDRDTLLVLAAPAGPTCHRGTVSCFDENDLSASDFLHKLERVIDQRLASGGGDSYVAELAAKGVERIAQKVGEEGVELAIAAVSGQREATIEEGADLLFHLLILLQQQGLSLDHVVAALEARAG